MSDGEGYEAIAEYDYQAKTNEELSFKKGDVVTIIDYTSEHWWFGELMGLKGLIPDRYIQFPKRFCILQQTIKVKVEFRPFVGFIITDSKYIVCFAIVCIVLFSVLCQRKVDQFQERLCTGKVN